MSDEDDKNEAWGFGGERPANDSGAARRRLDELREEREASFRAKEEEIARAKQELKEEIFKRDTMRLRSNHFHARKLARLVRGRRE